MIMNDRNTWVIVKIVWKTGELGGDKGLEKMCMIGLDSYVGGRKIEEKGRVVWRRKHRQNEAKKVHSFSLPFTRHGAVTLSRKSPSRKSRVREIEWGVAISWQLQSLHGCYGVCMAVTGFTSRSFSRKIPLRGSYTGEVYVMKVWPWNYPRLNIASFILS